MNLKEIMAKLEAAGSAQTRKTYARHCITGDVFGVSYAELGKLKRALKTNHPLAQELWATGNHDARILAMMIADPAQLTEKAASQWGKTLDNHVQGGALAAVVAQSPVAEAVREAWLQSGKEFLLASAWDIVTHQAANGVAPSNTVLKKHLKTIAATIHESPNRTRYSMNGALIAIGLTNEVMEAEAIKAAERIGKVEVDMGDTSCETPDAIAYIRKAAARKKAKK